MSNTKKDNTDNFMEALTSMIDDLFSNTLSNKEKPMQTENAPVVEQTDNSVYESIEDYTAKTGKRFRMTKEQKNLGLTRDEAFNQTFGDN